MTLLQICCEKADILKVVRQSKEITEAMTALLEENLVDAQLFRLNQHNRGTKTKFNCTTMPFEASEYMNIQEY